MISVRIYRRTGLGVIQYVRLNFLSKERAEEVAKAAAEGGADLVEAYDNNRWEVTFGDEEVQEEYIRQEGGKRSALQIAEDQVRSLEQRIRRLEDKAGKKRLS